MTQRKLPRSTHFLKAPQITQHHDSNCSNINRVVRTSISCHWRTCTTCCIMANVLQTKLDAQCDKPAAKLSWQCLWQLRFSSHMRVICRKSPIITYPTWTLNLASPLGVTPFEFCWDLRHQKTRVPQLGTVCVIIDLAISVEHWLVIKTHDYGIYPSSMASRGKN